MANQIRLKRGSGSNPSASDLAVGELAVRTDTGILFTKDDGGSVITLGGGGALSDGDYGDITVSNSGATFTIDSGVVNNAKVASNAAISLSKLEVITSNRIVGNDSGNAVPKELTAAEVRTIINVEDGATADQTAAEIKTLLDSNGIVNSNVDASAAIAGSKISPTFTSNITLASTTNGQALIITKNGTQAAKLGHIGSGNEGLLVLKDGGTDTVLLNGESGGSASYINSGNFAIGKTTASEKLDVVGNIAVTGTVDGRDVASDGSKLDGIESGATADQSASEILTLIKTVDGSGSGLDADTLDGISSASFVRSDANDAISGFLTITNDSGIKIHSSTNGVGSKIQFSDHAGGSYAQNGTLTYKHADGAVTTTGGNSNDGWLFEGSETRTVVKVVGDIEATSNIYGAGSNITALNASNISSGTLAAARVATLNQNTTGSSASCTGNSATATQLQNARTIAGTSFNGTANISINYNNLTNKPTIPTNNNQLTNGAGYITSASFSDVAGGGTFTGDISLSGGVGAMTVNGNSDIRFSNGTWSGNSTKIQHHSNYLYIQGGSNGIIFRSSGGTDRAFFNSDGDFIPSANNQYTLGNGSNRWQDVFTNDLHLSNEGGSNKVDNTWGDYTIQEGVDDLFIINNRNGKMFKFMLQEVK